MTLIQPSPFFKPHEFRCNGVKRFNLDWCCGGSAVSAERLVIALTELRVNVDRPVILDSGFRCVKYNNCCGGAKNSQHLYGMAADIHVEGMSVVELATECEKIEAFREGGIGIYDRGWVHVDVRRQRARWHRT